MKTKKKMRMKMGCLPGCFRSNNHQCVSMSVNDEMNAPKKLSPKEEEEDYAADEIASLIKHVSPSNSRVKMEEQTKGNKSSIEMSMVEGKKNGCGIEDDKLQKGEKGEAITLTPDPAAENRTRDFLDADKECVATTPLNSKVNIALDEGDDGIKESSCCCLESSGSLFSLSIDSKRQFSAAEMGDKEVISPLKLPENALCEEEEIDDDDVNDNKENVQNSSHSSKKTTVALTTVLNETSLSSWLAGSAVSCHNKSNGSSPESEKNYRSRQVLGTTISPEA